MHNSAFHSNCFSPLSFERRSKIKNEGAEWQGWSVLQKRKISHPASQLCAEHIHKKSATHFMSTSMCIWLLLARKQKHMKSFWIHTFHMDVVRLPFLLFIRFVSFRFIVASVAIHHAPNERRVPDSSALFFFVIVSNRFKRFEICTFYYFSLHAHIQLWVCEKWIHLETVSLYCLHRICQKCSYVYCD